jgi:hypothetical protein
MVDTGCGLFAMLIFLLGVGAGAVLIYVPSSFQIARLRRKLESAQAKNWMRAPRGEDGFCSPVG